MRRVLCVFGTRPEAIKMASVVRALERSGTMEPVVCVTSQHRDMLDQVLGHFDIRPHHDLDLMRPNQDLATLTSAVLTGLTPVLRRESPDLVLVHGDTTTTMATALAAFYEGLPVGHVEAGLRTDRICSPWPEEMNRRFTSMVTRLHFAPTELAQANLLREGVARERIRVTGNTVVDALLTTVERLRRDPRPHAITRTLDPTRRLVLVTTHRRENQRDGGLERVCQAVARLARRPDVQIVVPVHPNPAVKSVVYGRLWNLPNVHLTRPLDYLAFVALLDRAYLVITDSGGIQEEAPSLGKPVLVTRATTERPEALLAGAALLVGTDPDRIVAEAERLLDDPAQYARMSAGHHPYGDGRAADRIVAAIESFLASPGDPAAGARSAARP